MEEDPWGVSAEKPEKEKEDRAPLLRRNFSQGYISIEWDNWYPCARGDELSACDIVIYLIVFTAAASVLVWLLGFNHHKNVIDIHAYQSDGETLLNGKIDSPFQRSCTAFVGRRGLPSSQAEAAQIKAVQEALQKKRFRSSCFDHGRKVLQYNPPPNPQVLKRLDFSDLDAHADDYPNPGPNPSPPHHDYPPATSWSETKLDHTDYAPVGPHPSPEYHDYPPPASIV